MCNTRGGTEWDTEGDTTTQVSPTTPSSSEEARTPAVVYKEGDVTITATMTTTTPQPPGVTSRMPHSEHTTAPTSNVDSEPPSDDRVTSATSVRVFDESQAKIPDSGPQVLTGDEETATAIDAEYLISSTRASTLEHPTQAAGSLVVEGQTTQLTTEKQEQELDAGQSHVKLLFIYIYISCLINKYLFLYDFTLVICYNSPLYAAFKFCTVEQIWSAEEKNKY